MTLIKRRIGGTMASAIIGCNPYMSRHSAWLQLTGRGAEIQDNPQMKRGRDSEDIIAQLFELRHQGEYKVVHNLDRTETPLQVTHRDKDYLIGHPDRILIDPVSNAVAGGLEIKSAGIHTISKWGQDGSCQIPPHYYVQTQFYAGLCDIDYWPLFCAFFSNDNLVKDTREYPITLDRELYGSMIEEIDRFYKDNVLPDIEPDVDFVDETYRDWIIATYPTHKAPIEEATEDEANLIAEFIEKKAKLEEYEKELDALEFRIKNAIGDREGLISGSAKITWKKSKDSLTLNKNKLLESLDIADDIKAQFMETKCGSRRFLVTPFR